MGCDTEVEREQIDKYEFNTADKRIAVYPSPEPDSPIVYINTFEGEGDNVCRALENMDNPAFTLVAVSGLKWEHDMAPWDIPPLSKKSTPCIGGADDYLQLLREEIMPRAEKMADGVSWRGLAGYSLAGLFTVYSLYRTDLFSRIASVSGSLWFPGLMDYIVCQQKLCEKKHMSRYRLAQKSGIAQSSISTLLNRKSVPTIQTLEKICDGFGITLSQFFAEDDIVLDLTKDQEELLKDWNSMDSRQQELVKAYVQGIIRK